MTRLSDLVDLKGALAEGGWISSFAKVTRPLAVTMTVAILPIGGFMIGAASVFDPVAGANMAKNSVAFFNGLPEALYWMVGGIATGYFAGKTIETRSPTPPEGRPSPEATPAVDAAAAATVVDRAKPDPTMRDSDIAGSGDAAVQDATFDEDADPLAIAPAARLFRVSQSDLGDVETARFGVAADELHRDAGLDPLPRPVFGQADAGQLTGAQFETKELVL